ncbi:UDP-N-acetylmuramoyl-L-alanyl-D-glutamate--2,6-diaminopimelate ligase [Helicobacter cholecystus]|uniref:UDP-N-acetylmuramoyl-L-alanyl-D-glutamate--2, 6-diaminopimelate ligase n=1 Tax=Helicobacter cholecystus TaxID=45498 RepID=A0A3D8IUJ0_9HELI|nr:UDP-N-acetylmuramoyl-L-alanyl-D-glutamate--2,6-diaminopimelate ligase [Helicobacter cholecystus]RDU68959.1 UDP-N-acetylmuramoyl-L-alanyl-D-glutamate--2,6-diaminopimelate ligase [Helicobacter cholecystus]VEJ25993.1 UDP-N-acetylmuramoylalanyl-D-glutamate--2, 6-diaminopimelate ligase [Helicobacter cholecystus]
MKVNKSFNYQGHSYTSLCDDSIQASEDLNALFVRTTMNQKYQDSVAHLPSIDESELKNFFTLSPKIIAITGTNGKTTTAALIDYSLRKLGYKVALLGTRGFFINALRKQPKGLTTPTILELYHYIEEARECDFFVMEVSSHAIVQNRILGLDFALKALTNITSDHLDFHKDLQEYQRVKNSFFDGCTLEVINADEPNVHIQTPFLGYSLCKKAQVYSLKYSCSPFINATVCTQEEREILKSSMCGKHNLYNLLCAITSIKALTKYPLKEILESLQDFEGVEGRMQIVNKDPLIIVDFAHTYDGIEKILESFEGKKISVLFGAGGDRDKSKRPKMGEVVQKYAQKIYITSDNPRSENPQDIIVDILSGMRQDHSIRSINPIREQAIEQAIREQERDEILFILGKGDETYQIIGHQKIHFDDREVIASVLKSQEKRNINDA